MSFGVCTPLASQVLEIQLGEDRAMLKCAKYRRIGTAIAFASRNQSRCCGAFVLRAAGSVLGRAAQDEGLNVRNEPRDHMSLINCDSLY
jgi:hypothetical protein